MGRPWAGMDSIGAKYNFLTIVAAHIKNGVTFVDVRCDCGAEKTVRLSNIKSGQTKSCGCERVRVGKANATHGEGSNGRRSHEHLAWAAMISRCNNPRVPNYHDYGGRGISVCDRWRTYEYFLADMGRRPSHIHSLDRVDNNGNYEPSNCRWATREQQSLNKRTNRLITFNGETHPGCVWERKCGFGRNVIFRRIDAYGWSVDRALTVPSGATLRAPNPRRKTISAASEIAVLDTK